MEAQLIVPYEFQGYDFYIVEHMLSPRGAYNLLYLEMGMEVPEKIRMERKNAYAIWGYIWDGYNLRGRLRLEKALKKLYRIRFTCEQKRKVLGGTKKSLREACLIVREETCTKVLDPIIMYTGGMPPEIQRWEEVQKIKKEAPTEERLQFKYGSHPDPPGAKEWKGTLKDLKSIYREYAKRRRITVLDEGYEGGEAVLLFWSGSSATVHFEGEKYHRVLKNTKRVKMMVPDLP